MMLRLKLRAVTTVTVGGGFVATLMADIGFFKTPGGKFAIPGAALKGVLRTIASNIAPLYNLSTCGSVDPERLLECSIKGGCDVCSLFGRPGRGSSPLRVGTFYSEKVPSAVLTRVRISEDTGRAREGALFSVEVLPSCTEFVGEVRLYERMLPESRVRELTSLLLRALHVLRFHRLGRSDSIFDIKILNHEKILEKAREIGIPESLVHPLSSWYWTHVPCGDGT